MSTARKIAVEVPPELLEKAQKATGTGVTQAVRTGLQLVAASRTYARLRQLRGKVRFLAHAGRTEGRPMIAAVPPERYTPERKADFFCRRPERKRITSAHGRK
jgi:hypothetical protein